MKINVAERIKSLSKIIIILNITSLMILSFLPMAEIENYRNDNSLYFNFFSMEENDDFGIQKIVEEISTINYLIWAILILSLLSSLGIIFDISELNNKISKILLLFGIPVLFISLLVIYNYYNVIGEILELNAVSSPYLFEPIRYSYISMVFLIFLVLTSVFYFVALSKFFIIEYKNYIKNKKVTGRKEKKKNRSLPKKLEKKIETKEKITPEKRREDETQEEKKEEIKNWLEKETQKLDDKSTDKEKIKQDLNEKFEKQISVETKIQPQELETNEITDEENLKPKQEEIKIQGESEEKKQKTYSKTEKKDTKIDEKNLENKEDTADESKEKTIDFTGENKKIKEKEEISKLKEKMENEKTLDEALDNAIKKRDIDKTYKNKKKEHKTKEEVKKYNIKCPKCGTIFPIDKKEGKNKTKCPNCGKEGVIKF